LGLSNERANVGEQKYLAPQFIGGLTGGWENEYRPEIYGVL